MGEKNVYMRVNTPVLRAIRVFAGKLQTEQGRSFSDAETLKEFIRQKDPDLYKRLQEFETEEQPSEERESE